jgi:hypothetical protein
MRSPKQSATESKQSYGYETSRGGEPVTVMLPNSLMNCRRPQYDLFPRLKKIFLKFSTIFKGELCAALQQNGRANVRLGSKTDIGLAPIDVRFTPKSGHCRATVGCPLCAISEHCQVYLAIHRPKL